jgi:sterol desaturase/sphingolipid hydroxylase (fatty acid hydroxylase superfamily)
MTVLWFVSAILAGPVVVEVTGYFWHRWAEHNAVFGKHIQSYHIRHHEHDYPVEKLRPAGQNKYRSARSWGWYVLTVFLVLSTFLLVPRPYNFVMILSGLVYAKLVISYMHTRFHVRQHWLVRTKFFQRIQKLHDIHHYGPYNYGILFYFMDRIFGTYRSTFPKAKQNNFSS